MKVAEICPVCATYINAACIVYAGDYLPAIDGEPLEILSSLLLKIDSTYASLSGAGSPTTQVAKYLGQQYIDTNGFLWVGMSTSVPSWGLIGSITVTTTTTAAPTTTTTTTI